MTAAPTPSELSGRDRKTLFPVLCLVALVGQVGSFLYLPALPALAADFGVTPPAAQITVVGFLLGALVGFAVFGPVSDRLGRTRSLLAANAIFVAGSVVCAMSPNLEVMVAARVVQGLGSVAGIVTARAVIRDAWPAAEGALMMSRLSAANAIAPALSPIAGAALLTVIDWRAGFWLTAGIGALAALAAMLALPGGQRTAPGGALSGMRQVLASPDWWASLTVASACNATFLVMMAASPFVLMAGFGLSPLGYSYLMAGILAGFGVVAATAGGLAARFGSRGAIGRVLPPFGATVGVLLLASWSAAPLWIVVAALAGMVATMGVIVPSCHMAMMLPFPDRAATATSLGMLVATLTGAIAVALLGGIASGSLAAFGLVLAALACLVAVGWTMMPHGGAAA